MKRETPDKENRLLACGMWCLYGEIQSVCKSAHDDSMVLGRSMEVRCVLKWNWLAEQGSS
jgi:hypothetical protein